MYVRLKESRKKRVVSLFSLVATPYTPRDNKPTQGHMINVDLISISRLFGAILSCVALPYRFCLAAAVALERDTLNSNEINQRRQRN